MTFIHRYEWIAYGLLAVAAVIVSLPPYPYGWHLFMHIAGCRHLFGEHYRYWCLDADGRAYA